MQRFHKITKKFLDNSQKDNYEIVIVNGTILWLVYSISTDAVFCFACTLFGKCENPLNKGGFHTWNNIASHLKEHEYSKAHAEEVTN